MVAVMPKSKGNDYFKACKVGADKAAKELNVKLIWDGPAMGPLLPVPYT